AVVDRPAEASGPGGARIAYARRASARLGEGGGEAGEFVAQGPRALLLGGGGGGGLGDEGEGLGLVAGAVGGPGGDQEGAGPGGAVEGLRGGLVGGGAGPDEIAELEQGLGAGDEEDGEQGVFLAERRAAAGE